MAKVIDNSYRNEVGVAIYSWWRVALIGAAIGALYVLATYLIGKYAIDPLFCGNSLNAVACANSVTLSGNVATVIVGLIGLAVLVWLRTSRPLIIVLASALVAWGLSTWTNGLSLTETLIWSVGVYALTYTLFSWLARLQYTVPVLNWSLAIIIIARVLPLV